MLIKWTSETYMTTIWYIPINQNTVFLVKLKLLDQVKHALLI